VIVLRKIQEKDYAFLYTFSFSKQDKHLMHYILKDKDKKNNYHVIVYKTKILGFFNLYEKSTFELCLRAFFIEYSFQNKGYGSKTLTALIPYIKNNYEKYKLLSLEVNNNNTHAYYCYKKIGFEEV